jgi:hypothetical protein
MKDAQALENVVSGQVWQYVCARLAAAGEIILQPAAPATPLDRAEGWRYLSRLFRIALDMFVEHADPDFPVFYRASHETAKIGSDNPDNLYLNATIAGDRDYRISGTRGTMAYFSIGSKANRYHIDGTMASTGELDDSRIAFGPDGIFEIIASATPKPGNWLKLAADSTFIVLRQSYLDRSAETPGTFRIDRIGGPAAPPPLDPVFVDTALRRSADFVYGTAHTFAQWMKMFMEKPNRFADFGQDTFYKAGGDPNIFYCYGYFTLAEDEVWLIDTEVPDCPYWNIQLNNWWDESLDYRYHKIALNKHTAKLNHDGTLTVAVSAHDPGLDNWLTTDGHTSGLALLRWLGAKDHPIPRCRVMKLG